MNSGHQRERLVVAAKKLKKVISVLFYRFADNLLRLLCN